jgi:mannosyltransferase OCH1-like enzyme
MDSEMLRQIHEMIYTGEDFDTLVRKSANYSPKEQESPEWKLLKELYDKNYVHASDMSEKIPPKIHQIWLGGVLPEKFQGWCNTWREFHPHYEYRLWTDKDVDSIVMEKRDLFNAATNLGQKSDILRYEILRQQGGIYVDTDFECLKPFDDLLFLKFFTGISTDANAQLYIGILGSVPNHPIMADCADRPQMNYSGNNGDIIMGTTGPYYFTKCFLDTARKAPEGVVAFPMDFFYPFPGKERFTNTSRNYITPLSYAVHYWKTSWL